MLVKKKHPPDFGMGTRLTMLTHPPKQRTICPDSRKMNTRTPEVEAKMAVVAQIVPLNHPIKIIQHRSQKSPPNRPSPAQEEPKPKEPAKHKAPSISVHPRPEEKPVERLGIELGQPLKAQKSMEKYGKVWKSKFRLAIGCDRLWFNCSTSIAFLYSFGACQLI